MMVRCLQRLILLTATSTEGHWILLYWDSRLFTWIQDLTSRMTNLTTSNCSVCSNSRWALWYALSVLTDFWFGLVLCWICCSVDDSFLVIPRFLFPFSVSGKVWLSFSLQCNFWEFSSPTPNVQLLIKETTYNTINYDHCQGVECDWCRICGLQRALHSQQQHEVVKTWF